MAINTDLYAPFDSGAGADTREATWRQFMRHMLGSASGVIRGFSNEMAVTAPGGMLVTVGTGESWMRGHYGQITSPKTLPIVTADPTNPRIDLVVLRVDFVANVIVVDVLKGTAAATPVAPVPTQSTAVWEISLYTVAVAAATVSILTANLTDQRVFTTANAKYLRAGTLSVATNTFVKMIYVTVGTATGDVNAFPAGAAWTDFELERAGLWIISARFTVQNHASSRQISIVDSTNNALVYGAQTITGQTGVDTIMSCIATERFAIGKRLSVLGWQSSGGNLTIGVADLTLTWLGP